jgi:hypothetical protein
MQEDLHRVSDSTWLVRYIIDQQAKKIWIAQ